MIANAVSLFAVFFVVFGLFAMALGAFVVAASRTPNGACAGAVVFFSGLALMALTAIVGVSLAL